MKKERVVYYDCFVVNERYTVCPREAFSHGVLEHIMNDQNKEIVGIGIDKINKNEIKSFNPLSSIIIIQGMKSQVDKLIMPTMDIAGNYAAVIAMYKTLKSKGIKLQFFVEGEVDEKFIKILSFIQEKEDAWRKYAYKNFRRVDGYDGIYHIMDMKHEELTIGDYINEMMSEQVSLFNILESK